VAEVLFNGIGVDGYFMEHDADRPGSFAPLRFCRRARPLC
jgi:5-methyltetrahydropteroyltriglutamate--homocysteine methyltransferase